MSADALPISPAAFAIAIHDLPLTTLHLKAAEIRNSVAHLDYSNEQLKPFASPPPGSDDQPDQVCIDAIRENEEVISRMQERLRLLRAEVEGRGASWLEFLTADEVAKALAEGRGLEGAEAAMLDAPPTGAAHVMNGVNGAGPETRQERSPWTDGTFQTGRISGGEVVMDGIAGGAGDGAASEPNGVHDATTTNGISGAGGQGGRIGDDELRRRMEERMREQDEDDDGMHL